MAALLSISLLQLRVSTFATRCSSLESRLKIHPISVPSSARPFTTNSESINSYVRDSYCKAMNGCDPADSIEDQVNFLKQADSVDLWRLDLDNQLSNNFGWSAIPRDDFFFTTDALRKYYNGDLNTVDLVIGYNSHEGSLTRPYIEWLYANRTSDEILTFMNDGFGLFSFVNEWNKVMNYNLTLADHYNDLVAEFQSHSKIEELNQTHIHFLSKLLS